MIIASRVAAALLAAAIGLLPVPAGAQDTAPAWREAECFTPVPAGIVDGEDVRCGYVTVPLDHEDPDGPTIELAVAVLPAGGEDPRPDALVELAGGPGQSIIDFLSAVVRDDTMERVVARERDVVLMEQRGIGHSEPALDCAEIQDAYASEDTYGSDIVKAFGRCYERLTGEGHDLSAYNTLTAAADIDVVREALGYPQVNVVGTSYGTSVALQAARLFPDTVRSVVLSSPIPADANTEVESRVNLQFVLDEVFAACGADPGCRRAYPDLEQTLDRVTERLSNKPLTYEVPGGEVLEFSAEDLAYQLHEMTYDPEAVEEIPLAIHLADQGRVDELQRLSPSGGFGSSRARAGVALRAQEEMLFDDGITDGFHYSVQCAEEVAYADLDRFEAMSGDVSPLVRDYFDIFELYLPACDVWDVPRVDPVRFQPVVTDVPVMIVAGRFDAVTPVYYGQRIARTVEHAFVVKATAAAHDPLFTLDDCGTELVQRFLADPRGDHDASCARQDLAFALPEGVAAGEAGPAQAIAPAPAADAGGDVPPVLVDAVTGLLFGLVAVALLNIWSGRPALPREPFPRPGIHPADPGPGPALPAASVAPAVPVAVSVAPAARPVPVASAPPGVRPGAPEPPP